jgi:hypothetical protein
MIRAMSEEEIGEIKDELKASKQQRAALLRRWVLLISLRGTRFSGCPIRRILWRFYHKRMDALWRTFAEMPDFGWLIITGVFGIAMLLVIIVRRWGGANEALLRRWSWIFLFILLVVHSEQHQNRQKDKSDEKQDVTKKRNSIGDFHRSLSNPRWVWDSKFPLRHEYLRLKKLARLSQERDNREGQIK